MDQCTHEVRASYWEGIIRSCTQRPVGQTAKNWMDENGICEQSYYYWQRKFRQQSYEQLQNNRPALPAVPEKTDISFAQMPYTQLQQAEIKTDHDDNTPVAVIRYHSISIEITNGISDAVLTRLLQELSHA